MPPFDGKTSTHGPDIATRAEMLAKMRVRPRPAYEQHFIPSGYLTEQTHRSVQQAHERRIDHLRERLTDAKDRLETGFAIDPLHGTARTDFDRSR
ncbi:MULTISPECIES: hypothetical protein [Alphaproteobacteria]|uniref:hypothetical protein n=1 Tax=Alphaproteobacteria TaxID=28211 RepID=UPI003296D2AC